MKYIWRMAILSALLSACTTATGQTDLSSNKPYAFEGYQEDFVKIGASVVLMLPRSSRFWDVKASISPTGIVYACGFVAGQASNGGITPLRPFIGVLDEETRTTFNVTEFPEITEQQEALIDKCGTSGMPISRPR